MHLCRTPSMSAFAQPSQWTPTCVRRGGRGADACWRRVLTSRKRARSSAPRIGKNWCVASCDAHASGEDMHSPHLSNAARRERVTELAQGDESLTALNCPRSHLQKHCRHLELFPSETCLPQNPHTAPAKVPCSPSHLLRDTSRIVLAESEGSEGLIARSRPQS